MSTEGDADGSVATVEQRMADVEDRVADLEAENERLRDELEAERQERKRLIHSKSSGDDLSLGSIFIADRPAGSMIDGLNGTTDTLREDIEKVENNVGEEIADLEQKVRGEQQNRGQQDSKLRRRIEALAEKMDVEIVESDILGEDKIRRVLKHGVSDVESKPTVTDHRAECLLRNIGKWGQKVSDANGRRLLIKSPVVADRMEDVRDESLATPQIKRVFSKVEAWGADSPRTVRTGRHQGVHRLKIELDTEDSDR